MTELLIRLCIKHPEDMTEQNRYNYGKLAGGTGIACNVILFTVKLLIGILSASMAIIADAFNNLSDAGSSVVTLFGFKLSAAPADKEHPFGHGRMEYLSALAVAALIMVAGFELAGSAIDKIVHPTLPEFNVVTLCILAVAIIVKLWMAFFYRNIGKRIHSDALMASYTDSRNDVLCTGVVLVASLVSWRFHIALDGYVGIAVAAFVLWSGFSVMKETVSPLLGQAPDPELVQNITKTVLSYDGVTGIHDLIVHNYGPGRVMVSLHAEVPCRADILKSHDTIDLVERELMEKYNVLACIHMDPVDTEDERVQELQKIAQTVLKEVDPTLSLHDFRVVHGETHTTLIFDMVFPFERAKEKDVLVQEIAKRIHAVDSRLYAVITAEQSYI